MDKNKTTRCENCHRATGGIFRIEQKNCWACGDAICTRCELYGQCEKCHKQDEEMRAVHESSDDDEEEEDDEDKDEGQGRPKKLRRLNDGKVKVCESCGNYSDTLRIKKVNATILGDCISRNDSWMIVCNDCSRGIDRSIGEDMSSCSDTSGYGEEGKEDEQGEEEEQTAEEVVEEDEPFILQWEQDDEAGDEQPEGPADVINPDVVQEGFHAGSTIGVSEYVDKQRNSRSEAASHDVFQVTVQRGGSSTVVKLRGSDLAGKILEDADFADPDGPPRLFVGAKLVDWAMTCSQQGIKKDGTLRLLRNTKWNR
jgi:hypothetical protein